MKILSLFDGISCARVALEKSKHVVDRYYASEVDKYAIQISSKNYPSIIQVGDVKMVAHKDAPIHYQLNDIDLLIGGSPCQDLSIAKKNRKGLDGERSGLFWEYVRILKEVKPKYFVLENVNSMPKEAKAIITETLGVEPIMINASLVSAQNRKRLFWVGRLVGDKYKQVEISQPQDKGILLKDILEPKVDDSFIVRPKSNTVRTSGRGSGIDDKHNWDTIRIGQIGKGGQGDRIYSPDGKSVGLSALGGGRGAKTGLYAVKSIYNKTLNYNKANTLGSNSQCQSAKTGQGLVDFDKQIIRKLTPIECERLQSLHEIEQSCIIKVCKDNQNNSVNVEVLNPKSQNVVGSVEKDESKETAKYVEKNLNTNLQQINKPVLVDVSINCSESSIEIYSQDKLLVNVSGVELNEAYHPLKHTADFVHLLVGLINILTLYNSGKNNAFWRGGITPEKQSFSSKRDENNVVNIYGKEIMQLAKDVENDSITLKKLLKSTISDLSTQENNEQIIQTLFSCVVLAILRYIPREIQNKNILTFQINTKIGYTWGISNSQRYKCLGNAFNVDVVAHILSFIPKL